MREKGILIGKIDIDWKKSLIYAIEINGTWDP